MMMMINWSVCRLNSLSEFDRTVVKVELVLCCV